MKTKRVFSAIILYLLCTACLTMLLFSLYFDKVSEEAFKDYTQFGYIKLIPMPYSSTIAITAENMEQIDREIVTPAYNKLGALPMEHKSKIFHTINSSPYFYMATFEGRQLYSVNAHDLNHYPDFLQTYWGAPFTDISQADSQSQAMYEMGQRSFDPKSKYQNNGWTSMEVVQITSDLPEAASLQAAEGQLYKGSILYSDYIGTGKPLPVAIGWELRDLLSLGDLVRADASAFAVPPKGLTWEGLNERYSEIYPDGNLLLEVTAILTEDSSARFIDGNVNSKSLSRAILVPRFDLYNTLYEDLDNAVDRQVYTVLGTNMTTLMVFTSLPAEKAHEAFMDLIREADSEEYIKDTDFHMSTYVEGISLATYRKNCLYITAMLLFLLIIITVIELLRNVSRSEKKYAAHFMLGASQKDFFFGCVRSSWLAAVAGGSRPRCYTCSGSRKRSRSPSVSVLSSRPARYT